MAAGGLSGAVFNAAKEVALDLYIAGALRFPQMAELVEATLQALCGDPAFAEAPEGLEQVLAMDHLARRTAQQIAAERGRA